MIVYSKANCQQCNTLISLLNKNEIKFEVVKIDEDETARTFLLANGHRSVPQVYDNNNYIGGYKECMELYK
jgi:glutaredoxin